MKILKNINMVASPEDITKMLGATAAGGKIIEMQVVCRQRDDNTGSSDYSKAEIHFRVQVAEVVPA